MHWYFDPFLQAVGRRVVLAKFLLLAGARCLSEANPGAEFCFKPCCLQHPGLAQTLNSTVLSFRFPHFCFTQILIFRVMWDLPWLA
jgi:hypothetical protein